MKVNLSNITSGTNTSAINDNFTQIGNALNNATLYRDNPVGEPNQMVNLLDMNANRVINLPSPIDNTDAARLQDVQDAIAGAKSATLTTFTPYKNITSANVQGAIQQVYDQLYAFRGNRFYLNQYVAPGNVDNGAAIQRFFNDVCTAGGLGIIDSGTYYSTIPLTIDFGLNRINGASFMGAGINNTIFDTQQSTGGLTIMASQNPEFYPVAVGFGVKANCPTAALDIGSSNFSDQINEGKFQLLANNFNATSSSIGVRFNSTFNCDYFIVANAGGFGSASQVRQTQFSRFMGSFGHASTAMRFMDGYSYSNVFDAIDWEVVSTCVTFEVATAFRNTFIGGQLVWDNGASAPIAAINATAGNNNRFINTNFATAGTWATGQVGLIIDNSGYGTMQFGGVQVKPITGDAALYVDAPTGNNSSVRFRRNGVDQFAWAEDSSGNLLLQRYVGGSFTDNPIYADTSGQMIIAKAALQTVGFNGNTPVVTKPTITGSRGGNAALASILNAGVTYGLWNDSTTA